MEFLSYETIFILIAAVIFVLLFKMIRYQHCNSNRCFEEDLTQEFHTAMIYCKRCNNYTCHIAEKPLDAFTPIFEHNYHCLCCAKKMSKN